MFNVKAYEKEQERKDKLLYRQLYDFKTDVYYTSDYGFGYLYESITNLEYPNNCCIEKASQIIKEIFKDIVVGKGVYPLRHKYGIVFVFKTNERIDIIIEEDDYRTYRTFDYVEKFKEAINFKIIKTQTTHEDFMDAVRMITK